MPRCRDLVAKTAEDGYLLRLETGGSSEGLLGTIDKRMTGFEIKTYDTYQCDGVARDGDGNYFLCKQLKSGDVRLRRADNTYYQFRL